MPAILTVHGVIELAFDPILTFGGWTVRLQTVALAAVVLACLVLAALIGRRTPVDVRYSPEALGALPGEPNRLRADDLLYIAVASLPGAVAGGRLGYALIHLDFYRANPGALADVGQGSFELCLAVVGGTLTAAIVAGLLGAPIGRWLHAMILPLLLAIAGGKAALILGGVGQGQPFDGAWATAYAGQGPWGSLAPAVPAHPAQAYEALATAGVLLVLTGMLSVGAFGRRDGRAFLLGVAMWAAVRAAVAVTWRDPATVGPLNTAQAIAITVAVGALVLLVVAAIAVRLRPAHPTPVAGATSPGGRETEWPDPTTRPRF